MVTISTSNLGLNLKQRRDSPRFEGVGSYVYLWKRVLVEKTKVRMLPIIAMDFDGNGSVWYGQLVLCFIAKYFMGRSQNLCYVRWLGTAEAVAEAQLRAGSSALKRRNVGPSRPSDGICTRVVDNSQATR